MREEISMTRIFFMRRGFDYERTSMMRSQFFCDKDDVLSIIRRGLQRCSITRGVFYNEK